MMEILLSGLNHLLVQLDQLVLLALLEQQVQ
jgi:hypothetical protein